MNLDGKAICQWIRLLPLIFNHGSAVPWHPWQLKKPWHKVASLPLSTPIKSWHAPFSAPQSSTGNSWSMCFFQEKKGKIWRNNLRFGVGDHERSNSNSAASIVQGTGTACWLSVSKTGACFGGQGNQCTESVQSLRYLSQDVVRCC